MTWDKSAHFWRMLPISHETQPEELFAGATTILETHRYRPAAQEDSTEGLEQGRDSFVLRIAISTREKAVHDLSAAPELCDRTDLFRLASSGGFRTIIRRG